MCPSDTCCIPGTDRTPVPGPDLPPTPGCGLRLCRDIERTLAPGIVYRRLSCRTADDLPLEAYAILAAPDAAADILISAAPAGQVMTVPEHAARSGRRILAAVNAGFFHMASGTMLPYGLLIADGQVLSPLGRDGMRSLYWFGVTRDGRHLRSRGVFRSCGAVILRRLRVSVPASGRAGRAVARNPAAERRPGKPSSPYRHRPASGQYAGHPLRRRPLRGLGRAELSGDPAASRGLRLHGRSQP